MTDYKALISEARASANRNAVDDWPELAAQLITELADALEAAQDFVEQFGDDFGDDD